MQFIIIIFTLLIFVSSIIMILYGLIKSSDLSKSIGFSLLCISLVGYVQIMFIKMEESMQIGSPDSSSVLSDSG